MSSSSSPRFTPVGSLASAFSQCHSPYHSLSDFLAGLARSFLLAGSDDEVTAQTQSRCLWHCLRPVWFERVLLLFCLSLCYQDKSSSPFGKSWSSRQCHCNTIHDWEHFRVEAKERAADVQWYCSVWLTQTEPCIVWSLSLGFNDHILCVSNHLGAHPTFLCHWFTVFGCLASATTEAVDCCQPSVIIGSAVSIALQNIESRLSCFSEPCITQKAHTW